jgi:hypothetical protein
MFIKNVYNKIADYGKYIKTYLKVMANTLKNSKKGNLEKRTQNKESCNTQDGGTFTWYD